MSVIEEFWKEILKSQYIVVWFGLVWFVSCVYLLVCACLDACACGDQKSSIGLFLYYSLGWGGGTGAWTQGLIGCWVSILPLYHLPAPPYFFEVSHWTWSLETELDWLARKLRRAPVSASLALGLQAYTTTPIFSMWLLGIKFKTSCLHCWALESLSYFPSSWFDLFSNHKRTLEIEVTQRLNYEHLNFRLLDKQLIHWHFTSVILFQKQSFSLDQAE